MDRSPESQLILACIGNRLDDARTILRSERISLRKLSGLADKNLIRAALAASLLDLEIPAYFPRLFLLKTVNQNKIARDILLQQASWCCRILEEKKIPMIVLKGLTLPDSVQRDINDLDILVHRSDLLISMKVLSAAGYRYIGDVLNSGIRTDEIGDFEKQAAWNNQFQFMHEQTNLTIELHINLFQNGRVIPENLDAYTLAINEVWDRKVRYENFGFDGLCREDLFLLMCVHGSVKRSPGMNRFALRTVLDMKALMHEGLDWSLVMTLAMRYALCEHLLLGVRLLNLYYPGSIPGENINEIKQALPGRLRLLSAFQFKTFNGLGKSRHIASYLYRALMPFFYKGSPVNRIGYSAKAILSPLRRCVGLNATDKRRRQ